MNQSVKARVATSTEQPRTHPIEMRFDMRGLRPEVNPVTEVLNITVPVFMPSGPVVSKEMIEELVEGTGLSLRDIEDGIDKMMEEFQTRSLAKLLMSRRA